jgi:hypothetical protein
MRRVLLPSSVPHSLTAAASLVGLPAPHRVTIMGSYRPVASSSGKSTTYYYAGVYLLAFDAAGKFVGQHDKQAWRMSVFDPAASSSFNGAVFTDDPKKYVVDVGFLKSAYYWDSQCAVVDLDAPLAQGICSLAVSMLLAVGWRLSRFKRKAVRIVETSSKTEIGVYHVAAPWVGKRWGMLVGGLVFTNDCWSWVPAGDLVKNQNTAGFHACWYERLLQSREVPPK